MRQETKATTKTEAKQFRRELKTLVSEGKAKDVQVKKVGSEWRMTWTWVR